ncbi:hypothetical protein Btru_030447 [Bulinus truncatus]|nr:hypothetical protein Btru_030447 [Bulinus truncatus]
MSSSPWSFFCQDISNYVRLLNHVTLKLTGDLSDFDEFWSCLPEVQSLDLSGHLLQHLPALVAEDSTEFVICHPIYKGKSLKDISLAQLTCTKPHGLVVRPVNETSILVTTAWWCSMLSTRISKPSIMWVTPMGEINSSMVSEKPFGLKAFIFLMMKKYTHSESMKNPMWTSLQQSKLMIKQFDYYKIQRQHGGELHLFSIQ